MNRSSSDRPVRLPGRGLTRRAALAQVGLAAAGAAIAGVAPGRAAAQEATPAAPGESTLSSVTPERAALATARIPELARDMLERSGVPGMAVAVVYDDAVTFSDGFGVRELGKDAPIDVDTVFQLASVSKSLASTVVASVVGDGTMSWTSRMADVAPGFSLHDAWPTQQVSLADLFSHRSGLRDHAGDLLEDLGFERAEILHRLRYLEPAYSFREGYLYTNYGLTAAAVAAAAAVGRTWEDLSQERLYAPLGMTDTSSRFSDYMARANRAIPHVRKDGVWQVTPQQRDPDAQSPAGGASSSARDVAQWMRLMLGQGVYDGKQVIPAAALAPVHTPQSLSTPPHDPATDRAGFYGLGVNISYTEFGTVQWGHSGAFALGAATAYYLLPGSGFGVLALTNGAPMGVPEALCLSVLDLAQTGKISRDWLAITIPGFAAIMAPTYGTGIDWGAPPAPAAPAHPLETYVGTYRNAYYGETQIVAAGDGLALRIGPQPTEYALTHFDGDIFHWQPPGENAYGPSGLSFVIGPHGEALGFRDEYLESGGPGFLARAESDRG